MFDGRECKRATIRLRLHGGELAADAGPSQGSYDERAGGGESLLASRGVQKMSDRISRAREACCCEIARGLVLGRHKLGSLLLRQHMIPR